MQQWGGEVRGLSYKLPRFFEQTYFLPIITYLKCKYSLKYYNNTFRSVLQTYIKILINISYFSFTTTAQLTEQVSICIYTTHDISINFAITCSYFFNY